MPTLRLANLFELIDILEWYRAIGQQNAKISVLSSKTERTLVSGSHVVRFEVKKLNDNKIVFDNLNCCLERVGLFCPR